ncbi:MAG TPA: STM4015 family protein [Chloroflexota bacterium]|nr:STM4015 family protein [Chloroflexota bacterium]
MTIDEHLTHFAGRAVVDWEPHTGLPDPDHTIYRVGLSDREAAGGQRWTDKLSLLLNHPAVERLPGLVVGAWDFLGAEESSAPVVEALVAARGRLAGLRAIFLGDVISEEQEISWITQSDLSPLFNAYPLLEHVGVRGGTGLTLGSLRHAHLKSLIIQSGGLEARVVREVGAAQLPELEHLELWLGAADFGATATVEDLAPVLDGAAFPKLRYLGLRNSELGDDLAAAVAGAPVLARLRVLDLSLGTVGDAGAAALLASPATGGLERLDLHHHFCSAAMVARLVAGLEGRGVAVDAGQPQQEAGYGGQRSRYVAVGE